MTELFAFISGFLLCAALNWKRIRESRRAFDAACGENEILREREGRYRETIVKLRDGIGEVRDSLGGTVTLPAAARPIGQLSSLCKLVESNGPSSDRRSHFSGREQ